MDADFWKEEARKLAFEKDALEDRLREKEEQIESMQGAGKLLAESGLQLEQKVAALEKRVEEAEAQSVRVQKESETASISAVELIKRHTKSVEAIASRAEQAERRVAEVEALAGKQRSALLLVDRCLTQSSHAGCDICRDAEDAVDAALALPSPGSGLLEKVKNEAKAEAWEEAANLLSPQGGFMYGDSSPPRRVIYSVDVERACRKRAKSLRAQVESDGH